MAFNRIPFKIIPSLAPPDYSAQKLNLLQADLASTARMWAVDEVRAAMAHQISDPLTALLLYLHEIKERRSPGAATPPDSVWEMVDNALREAERICEIVERMGHSPEAPVDAESAVARGRDAIDSWMRSSNGHSPAASPHSSHRTLTPRERETLDLIVNGASNKEGAHRLGITTRTFEVHRAHIMEKLGARNAADLVRMALSRDG